jgi:hypothetical protein
MIGTIRKHSAWLWWVIAALTIISFIWWGASPGTRYGSGRSAGYGTLYGEKITPEEFVAAQREFLIYYWWQNKRFPTRAEDLGVERDTYVRLLLLAKARQLGIHISQDVEVAQAADFLRGLGREGQPPPQLHDVVDQVLQPAGLDASDFQRFIKDDLIINQLVQTFGLSGALITPQEAGQLYDRERQEVSAQAVFFEASNYLSQVVVTPGAVQQFYTNELAARYRLPDRVQLYYVEYDATNYLAAAEAKYGKTNLVNKANAYYAEKGPKAVPEAKTPEEAKAKLYDMILREFAKGFAADQAKQLLVPLFAIDPPNAANLVTLARTNGLTVHTTAPFSREDGPAEFVEPAVSAEMAEAGFKLTPDSPFPDRPIVGATAVYVVGLAKQLPSEIEPFSEIRDRVAEDYRLEQAIAKARTAGTNFYYNATVQMATGKTFAQVAMGAGQIPVALTPFSLSSPSVPEAEGRVELSDLKRAAFSTQPGHVSQFEPDQDGGFAVYVQGLLPVDESQKAAQMPRYLAQIRRGREQEAFNMWLQGEATREFRNVPDYDKIMARTPTGRP